MFSDSSNFYKIKDSKGNLLASFPKDVDEIVLDYKSGTIVDFRPLNNCETIEHIQLVPIDGLPGRAILPNNLPNLKRLLIGLLVENPEVLTNYSNLEILDVGGYAPKSLDFILSFPKLRSLDITAYNLHTIEPLSHFKELEELEFSSYLEADLSPLANCKNLKKLRLSYEPKGSEVLKELTNLEELVLSDFQTEVLNYLENAIKLKKLILCGSRMKNFEPLRFLINLTHLNLSWTRIDNQNLKYLSDLKNLIDLNLTVNRKISDLSPLENLLALEHLDLSILKGPIDSLKPLRNLRNLKTLDLLETPIKNDLFDSLLELQSLNELKITTSNEEQIKKLKTTLKNCSITTKSSPDPSTFIDIGFVRIWLAEESKVKEGFQHMIVQDVTDELNLTNNMEAENKLIDFFSKEKPELFEKMDFTSLHSIFQVYSQDKSALIVLARTINEMAAQ